MSPHSKLRWVSSVVATFLALTVSTVANAAPKGPANTQRPLFDAAAVERARSGATKRLRDPECLKVLTDFRDRTGQTLDRDLETWNLSAADYLQAIPFEDGSSYPPCQRTSVFLVTAPGLPKIYLCAANGGKLHSRFADVQVRNSALAEAMVIHEMLHSLGLGENPPSTYEITEKVQERCR
jgi:hypothetical protein